MAEEGGAGYQLKLASGEIRDDGSKNFDGFGENKIEYVSDMMRCYVDRSGIEGYERRDPFADSKKAKQLKQKLQKSKCMGNAANGFGTEWGKSRNN